MVLAKYLQCGTVLVWCNTQPVYHTVCGVYSVQYLQSDTVLVWCNIQLVYHTVCDV